MASPANGKREITDGDTRYDLSSILFSSNRDYLIRNNGDQVKADSLNGKIVGLYFSASWCGPCQRFTPNLVEVYNELLQANKFETVFVSGDEDNESFDAYFSKMPWLAIPFSDSETRERLDELFAVSGIPHLVILDQNGKVLTSEGVEVIQEHGAEGYPFSSEQIEKLKKQEEEARRNQSLKSLLVSRARDYVIMADGKKVPVVELEGKIVGLYFVLATFNGCLAFNPKLIEVYKSLREKGENFEIVMVPLDDDEASFKEKFENMPWFSLPLKDKCCAKLVRYFELESLPTLAVIGPDGKTLHSNVVEAIEEHGVKAYPFTPEKFVELEEIEKARREAQTLESILVSEDSDFVIGKDGIKIPVSDLVGKTVLLYFSAHWCPPCRAFLPALMEAYHKINENGNVLEVVFISSDRDQTSFNEFFSKMPWLALPFGDKRKESLSRTFKVRGIPMVVTIGPNGKTVSTEARELIMCHGAEAYPFTSERLKEIEASYEKMAESWPKKVKYPVHDHELILTKHQFFNCDGCGEEGRVWSYYCEDCDFDLHPKCALDEDSKEMKGEDEGKESVGEEKGPGEGWICDGEMCYRD
ncbi:Thioredoxin, nucleoredoxin [Handroanthus impetiginosus]|uniref:protein-disulfide reductase n=1 Tax=Handroanthus impetiginosus TaxID=429701 RepID=A0A2G9I5T9_9LAMI|nr:Thioredoxin, nucleoredoxin [Handroanthus impetiginosus]